MGWLEAGVKKWLVLQAEVIKAKRVRVCVRVCVFPGGQRKRMRRVFDVVWLL